jgi:hypothetical protein
MGWRRRASSTVVPIAQDSMGFMNWKTALKLKRLPEFNVLQ